MRRKDFIKQGLIGSMGLPLLSKTSILPSAEPKVSGTIKIPPFLRSGDIIAITSPAGFITEEGILPAVQQMESWGLQVKIGATIGKREGTFGGTDLERVSDMQRLMDDDSVNAIMCARGGYGMVRIIDQLDFTHFRKHPKWIIGFSDVTVLHAHLNRNIKVASIHSKMCNSFPDEWLLADQVQQETITSIRDTLFGKPMSFTVPFNSNNTIGEASGELIGGNCKTFESLAGSDSDIKTAGKILFLEDTGEYLYSIDRMFWNLKRSGKLDDLAGLIIGGFKYKPTEKPEEEFGSDIYQIVKEKLAGCIYPVCFDFPVGHQHNNYALKCGVKVKLSVTEYGTILTE